MKYRPYSASQQGLLEAIRQTLLSGQYSPIFQARFVTPDKGQLRCRKP